MSDDLPNELSMEVSSPGTECERMLDDEPPRRERAARRRSLRSWALHGLVVAGGVGAVALDRRLRRSRVAELTPIAPLVVAVSYQGVLWAFERRHPHDRSWRPSRAEVATDLAWLASTLVVAGGAIAAGEAAASGGSEGRKGLSRLPAPVGATISLLVFDLVHSRFHQLLHVWGPGWRFHAVHHSSKGLYWMNAGRTHAGELAVDAFIEGFVTQRLGLSRDQLVAHQAVRVMYGNLEHCNVDLRSGVLDRVFSTPDLHRWHHSTVYEEGDSNFGVFTSIWDQLFGSWYRPDDREGPDELGVGRMPDFPTRFVELLRVPIDWPQIRERNAATWGEPRQRSRTGGTQASEV